jgi:hypothetical protein
MRSLCCLCIPYNFCYEAYEIKLLYARLYIPPPNFSVFYAVRVVSRESRRLILIRNVVIIDIFRANAASVTKDGIENKWTERVEIMLFKKSIVLWASTPCTSVEIYRFWNLLLPNSGSKGKESTQKAKRTACGKPDSDVGPVISPERQPVRIKTGVHKWDPEIGHISKNGKMGESERNGGASGQRKVQVSLERNSGCVQNAARDERKKQLRKKFRTESSERCVS